MWVIFLLSALSVALAMLLILYVANKLFIRMKKYQDEYQIIKDSQNQNQNQEKEN